MSTLIVPTTTFNPLSWNIRFPYTTTDEWLNHFCKHIQKRFKNLEGVSNMHFHTPAYKTQHPEVLLKDIEWYRLKVWADVGGSEGYYVRLEAEHRKTGVSTTLISCKCLVDLAYAIEVVGFMTMEVLGQWRPSTGVTS